MRCFQTGEGPRVEGGVALANVAIAAWAALMPQYAFISWMAGALYYHVAVRWLEPLCEWRKYYYAVFAAGGVASIATYIYAPDATVKYAELGDRIIFGREVSPGEYVVWMAIQWLSIFFTMLLTSFAYAFALKGLLPSKDRPTSIHRCPQARTTPTALLRCLPRRATSAL